MPASACRTWLRSAATAFISSSEYSTASMPLLHLPASPVVPPVRYIFESPDGGNTIYRRVALQPVRTRVVPTQEQLAPDRPASPPVAEYSYPASENWALWRSA